MPIHDLLRKGHIQQSDTDEKFYTTLLKKLNETLDSMQLFLFSFGTPITI